VYQSKEPRYAILLFGLEGKTRVWVVWDGDQLFVDRNGDGDLTGPDERLEFPRGFLKQPVTITAGKVPITITLYIREYGLQVSADVEGKRTQYGSIDPTLRPADARALHFDGPLVMGLQYANPSRQPVRRGSKPYDYAVLIQTNVSSQKGVWGPVIDHKKYVPTDVHPAVEFEFASKWGSGKTVKMTTVLKERC
jgi:hypothetical protein